MIAITDPQHIETFRLICLRSALRLEIKGMKRRGRSAATIAKELLGLPVRTPNAEVEARLTKLIEERTK